MSEEELLGLEEESTEPEEDFSDGGYHNHSKSSKEVEEVEEEEEPEIEVVADKKKGWTKDPMESVNEDNDDDYSKSVKKRIGKLRASATELARQRDEIAREKEQILAFAKSQQERLTALETQYAKASKTSIKHQEDNFTQMSVMAENEYKNALLTGNADQIAAAHNKLTDAKVNLAQLKRDAANQEAEIERLAYSQKKAQTVQQPQVQAVSAPQLRVQWFQKNPWFNAMGEDEKSAYAIHLDRKLQSEGYEGDSPEYFEAIDKGMRTKFPSAFGIKRTPVTPPATRQSSQTTNSPIQGNKIVLTQSEMNTAKRLGIKTPAQLKRYALEIAKTRSK